MILHDGRLEVGVRKTRQKRAITDCLVRNRFCHMTAEQVAGEVRAAGEGVGQATVYRVLKALEKEGVVRKCLAGDGQSACYQYIGDAAGCRGHFHLVCINCAKLFHVGSRLLERFLGEIRQKKAFVVDQSRMAFYGICGDCSEKDSAQGGGWSEKGKRKARLTRNKVGRHWESVSRNQELA